MSFVKTFSHQLLSPGANRARGAERQRGKPNIFWSSSHQCHQSAQSITVRKNIQMQIHKKKHLQKYKVQKYKSTVLIFLFSGSCSLSRCRLWTAVQFCGIMKLALSQQALIAICNCQVEPVCSEVRHPRGDPRALEAQPGCVQARKAEHIQES